MKRFFKVVGLVLLTIVGSILLLITVAYAMGTVTVSVHEKKAGGTSIYVPVPSVLVPIGVAVAPRDEIVRGLREARPYLPAIKAAAEELARYGDVVLVEVSGPDEHVRIAKQGSDLVIDVDSADENVHVATPLETIYTVASQLESAGDEPRYGSARAKLAADIENEPGN